ncbi:MAG: GNAT family N-acetyltransferase [Tepidiformaceae bacterium]
MPDMLVKLYDLPGSDGERRRLESEGVTCRRAEGYERTAVVAFVAQRWPRWQDEATAGFARVPPTVFIASRGGEVVGFAAYNVTRPDYFGPTGVDEGQRKRGIGGLLLLQSLEALAAEGYAYAIIGGVGPASFYERAVGAITIAGSDPGIYRDRLS